MDRKITTKREFMKLVKELNVIVSFDGCQRGTFKMFYKWDGISYEGLFPYYGNYYEIRTILELGPKKGISCMCKLGSY